MSGFVGTQAREEDLSRESTVSEVIQGNSRPLSNSLLLFHSETKNAGTESETRPVNPVPIVVGCGIALIGLIATVMAFNHTAGPTPRQQIARPAPVSAPSVPAPSVPAPPLPTPSVFASSLAAPAVPASGRLEVASDPPGGQVTLNGAARGKTPVTFHALAPGDYTVVITRGSSRVERRVKVAAGGVVSVMASLPPASAPASTGWLTIRSPIELSVYRGRHLIGTSGGKLALIPGTYELDLVNEALGFRKSLSAHVTAGAVATVGVAPPTGLLSINATPWAEVYVDGQLIGITPLANVPVPLGARQVIWRHPQLGERTQTVVVTARNPARVGMDFGRQP